MAKRIGVDLDGTLNMFGFHPKINVAELPWWFFIPLIPFIFLTRPNKRMLKVLRKLEKDGNEIIIISARPKEFTSLTKLWLRYHKIPFSKVFCVGFGNGIEKRKLEIIKKEKIEVVIDDDENTVKFLRKESIMALLPEEFLG